MKGIILAAGKGTRLYPITKEISKMILPIFDKPVIYYPIKVLFDSGIKEIMIVCGKNHLKQLKSVTLDQKKFKNVKFKFKTTNQYKGMPQAIYEAKNWAKKDSIMVIPGDNLFDSNYKKEAEKFKDGAVVHLKKVKDPKSCGTIIVQGKKIIDLIEKPKKTQTKFALIAPYFFDKDVYKFIETLKVSPRGELEIVDLLRIYFLNKKLKFVKSPGYWADIGTHEALFEAGVYFHKKLSKTSNF